MFDVMSSSIEHVRAGKLRALAVTSATRSDVLPGIPAMGEFLPGYEAISWGGIGAPRGTPDEIIARLNTAINATLAEPSVKARLAEVGSAPMPMTPVRLATFVAEETEKWGKVIRAADINAE